MCFEWFIEGSIHRTSLIKNKLRGYSTYIIVRFNRNFSVSHAKINLQLRMVQQILTSVLEKEKELFKGGRYEGVLRIIYW